jgi:Mor family transcriptional regulator
MSDILSRVSELLAAEGITPDQIVAVHTKLRNEFSGQQFYIAKREADIDAKVIEQMKRSANAAKVAKQLQISRATVYRILSRRRK